MPDTIDVYFVVLENSLALDLVGPAEALRIANRVLESKGQSHLFNIHYVGVSEDTSLSIGLQISNIQPLPNKELIANKLTPSWFVLLGQEGIGSLDPDTQHNQHIIDWLKNFPIKIGHVELIGVCAGSLLFAYAGLLDNKQATTHHRDLMQLVQTAPLCMVQDDCVFVEDGAIASSAGVTTGIDLMVYKIAQICGEVVASDVAQWLVMPHRRSAKDSQHSKLLAHRSHLHPMVHKVQEAISLNPSKAWTLAQLADVAHTSPRNISRLFKQHADISPINYLNQVRLTLAKVALANRGKSGMSVTEIAQQVGFSSDVQLRRVWQSFGEVGSPSSYMVKQQILCNNVILDC